MTIEELAKLAATYLDVADAPRWAGEDCRECDKLAHTPECPYRRAEVALMAAVEKVQEA